MDEKRGVDADGVAVAVVDKVGVGVATKSGVRLVQRHPILAGHRYAAVRPATPLPTTAIDRPLIAFFTLPIRSRRRAGSVKSPVNSA